MRECDGMPYKQIKVSIIIPVFNAEEYIENCLSSIVNQSSDDTEIILVDDCSKDKSCDRIKAFILEHNLDARCHVIQMETNRGQSSARNCGLDVATGQYLMFVDADDYLDNACMETISHRLLQEPDCQLLSWGMYYDKISEGRTVEISPSPLNVEKDITISKPTANDWITLWLDTFFASPCNKLYNRSIIEKHHIRFDASCVEFEDLLFNIEYVKHIDRFTIVTDCLYHYRQPVGQISALKRRWDKVDAFVVSKKVTNACTSFVAQQREDKSQLKNIYRYAYKAFSNELEYSYRKEDRSTFHRKAKKLVSMDEYRTMLQNMQNTEIKKVIVPLKIIVQCKLSLLNAVFLRYLTVRSVKATTSQTEFGKGE